jgi:hypothetical protein
VSTADQLRKIGLQPSTSTLQDERAEFEAQRQAAVADLRRKAKRVTDRAYKQPAWSPRRRRLLLEASALHSMATAIATGTKGPVPK